MHCDTVISIQAVAIDVTDALHMRGVEVMQNSLELVVVLDNSPSTIAPCYHQC